MADGIDLDALAASLGGYASVETYRRLDPLNNNLARRQAERVVAAGWMPPAEVERLRAANAGKSARLGIAEARIQRVEKLCDKRIAQMQPLESIEFITIWVDSVRAALAVPTDSAQETDRD